MPRAEFFARRGLLVVEDFLGPDFCAALCAELREASATPSRVERRGAYLVDEDVRRTSHASVGSATRADVQRRLSALRPRLESHFGVRLTELEPPTFVVYRAGDFFRPHRDAGTADESPDSLKARKVALVVFLNDEAELPQDGAYCGGSLTFYGLVDEPPWHAMGFPLVGEAGLLVGFPADMVHEVTEVTHGERYVVVSRFR